MSSPSTAPALPFALSVTGASATGGGPLRDGDYSLHAQIADRAGNVASGAASFVMDGKPVTVLVPDLRGLITAAATVRVAARITSGAQPLLVTIGGAAAQDDGELYYGDVSLTEGNNRITVAATDVIDQTTSTEFTVVRDSQPPDLDVLLFGLEPVRPRRADAAFRELS